MQDNFIPIFANIFEVTGLFKALVFMGFGIIGLYLGAEWLVRGSARLARALGIKPLVIGLTLVAFGTSAPELLVSLFAALGKTDNGGLDASLGNIVGSNIANIGLILGITALILPLRVRNKTMKREFPFMIALSALFWLLAILGKGLQLIDGVILLACFVFFVLFCIFTGKSDEEDIPEDKNYFKNITIAIVGLLLLAFGASALVEGSVFVMIKELGIDAGVVGLTVLAFGTSLPELVTSVIARLRGHSEISVGNVLGSNIFNIALVFGLITVIVGIVHPTVKIEPNSEIKKLAKLDSQNRQPAKTEAKNDDATNSKASNSSKITTFTEMPADDDTLWWDFPVMMLFALLVWGLLFLRRERMPLPAAKERGINPHDFTVITDPVEKKQYVRTLRLGRTAGFILFALYVIYVVILFVFNGRAPWS